jgi:TfoX/Sxy family transcriptional regulator of competence genes
VTSATATAMRKQRRVHGRTWRNSFLLGAVNRLAQRLDARRAETAAAGENGRALVLVKTAVDREIERRHPELERSDYRPSVAPGAYEAGSRAAKHLDIGDRSLGHRSARLPNAAGT